jgi:hypothetical protein
VSKTAVARQIILRGNSMLRSISIATLLISIAILPPIAQAQTSSKTYTGQQVSPFNLAYLAYQGYLTDLGIPSDSELLNAISVGKISAQDIIKAAIKANRLSNQTLSDSGYRDNLDQQLKSLQAN